MKLPQRFQAAFTLVEILVASGAVAILGVVGFSLLNLGLTLYTQNISLGQTQAGGREATEQLFLKVAAADEVPVLADDTGATQTGNGPAAGIRFYALASSLAYAVPNAANATDSSFTITQAGTRPAPQVGDKITMSDLGFQGVITSVSSSGSNYTCGFASAVGNGFTPVKTSGVAIPAGSKCFLLRPSAFISVGGVLRYYPRALSVAANGSSAFNDQGSFSSLATLLPIGTATNAFPFQYVDTTRRSLAVSLRVRAAAHGSRIGGFYTFQNMQTTLAYRSAVIR